MNASTYKLRIGDFKKLIRYILSFLGLSSAVFLISIFLHKNGSFENSPVKLEVFLVGYFILATGIFLLLVLRNYSNEELIVDSSAIQTQRFGGIYFNDIVRHRFQRHKNSEDVILSTSSGMKILIGPVNSSKKEDKLIYENFKEALLEKLSQIK
jgi:thiol:disulfide interchange protein